METTTVPAVTVERVDPRDEQALARWFAVVRAAEEHDRPGEPGELLHEQRQLALDGSGPDPDTGILLLRASVAGRVVGAARLELPMRDNRHLCELVLCVEPAARGGGVARALQAEVERCARERHRSTLLTYADEPPGSEGRSPSRAAAQALGYAVAQQEVRRDIDLPLDPARVARLSQACRPYAAGYALRTWRDACPDDLLVSTGHLVAFTAMGWPRPEPARAYQWETLVSAEHRGHRLGTLVKLAALQELAASSPRTRVISTWNAQENAPMIAVNDALGARTDGRLVVLQKVLT